MPRRDGSEQAFFGVNGEKVGALIDEMTATEADVQKAALRYMDDVYRRTILRADAAFNHRRGHHAAGGGPGGEGLSGAGHHLHPVQKRAPGQHRPPMPRWRCAPPTPGPCCWGKPRSGNAWALIPCWSVSTAPAARPACPGRGWSTIDDVWQPYHGSSNAAAGGSYGVSRNGRSYLLLSVAVKAGLFHPNCRHTVGTWIEGVSRRPKPMDKAKIEAVSKLEPDSAAWSCRSARTSGLWQAPRPRTG